MTDRHSHSSPRHETPEFGEAIFRTIFRISPERQLLVTANPPDFTILAASDSYLDLVMTTREELVGRKIFELFPEIPRSEQRLLRAALETAVREGTSQSLAAYRYDIPDEQDPGSIVERYWSPTVIPLMRGKGEVSALLLSIEEATDFILRERYISERHQAFLPSSGKRRAVLLVEPDENQRLFLDQTFATHWEVRTATNAAEALAMLNDGDPDVIVTEMDLPDHPGAGFIAQLKERSSAAIIVRVKQTNARQYREAFEAGADDVIGGPASAREFMARIQTQFTEQTLRETTHKGVHLQYHKLFMEAPVAISLLEGPDHVYTLANPALYDIVGSRTLIGLPVREAFPEPEIIPLIEELGKVYKTGEPFFASNISLIPHVNGRQRYVTFSYQPFRDAKGLIQGVASFAYDVTDQVEMRRSLIRENERKDVFLAMLGHELRNPLAPITQANEILRSSIDHFDPELLKWVNETIGRQVNQLKHHVDELLDVARMKRGQIKLNRSPASLQKILTGAVSSAQGAIKARHQTLHLDIEDKPIAVDVDAFRLTQVVTNLLDNASKYTPDGGEIELQARLREESGEHRLLIDVLDNGQGIDPSLLPDLFELFTRADVSLDRSQGGLGLGLALVKGIVEMHDGIVRAYSEGPGRGSRFTVEIPVEVTSLPASKSPSPPSALEGVQVLVVDDLPDLTEAMARLLELHGATVLTARSGVEALERASQFQPTHILLDIGLPDLDGYEVVRRLRQTPEGRNSRIAALTGYCLPSDRKRTLEAGFDRHFTKPAPLDQLLDFLSGSQCPESP